MALRISPSYRLRRTFGIGLAILFVPVLGLTVAVAANGQASIADVRAATAKFHDVAAARAAGYAEFRDAAGIACIDSPTGTMGIHYVKGSLVGDGVIDPLTPEALVYEPLPNGGLRLVALEYVEIQAVWHAAHGESSTPTVLGRSLRPVGAGNRYGLPPFFQRHAWIWSNNPLGQFEEYSSKVSCR
jgi:hypothetical protein